MVGSEFPPNQLSASRIFFREPIRRMSCSIKSDIPASLKSNGDFKLPSFASPVVLKGAGSPPAFPLKPAPGKGSGAPGSATHSLTPRHELACP